jgi:hypothetical protein
VNEYAFWQEALQGRFGPIHESDPQPGAYRMRNRAGGWDPVLIWQGDQGVICAMRGNDEVDPVEVWSFCVKHPISDQVYSDVIEGKPWPDSLPDRALSNLPSDPRDALEAELTGEQAEIDAWLKQVGEISRKEDADRAANWAERIAGLEKRGEALRKAEKAPIDEAAKKVQTRWVPVIDRAAALKRKLKDAITPFLRAEAKRQADERAAAVVNGEEVAVPKSKGAAAGTAGHKVALRTVKRAVIEDYDAALNFFRDNAELRALVQTLADRCARVDAPVPGCKFVKEEIAA